VRRKPVISDEKQPEKAIFVEIQIKGQCGHRYSVWFSTSNPLGTISWMSGSRSVPRAQRPIIRAAHNQRSWWFISDLRIRTNGKPFPPETRIGYTSYSFAPVEFTMPRCLEENNALF